MAVSPVVCTACGVRPGAERAFCTSCGRPLGGAPRALLPVLQTQFSLPDYLKTGARRPGGRRRAPLEEPPGPGMLIAGAVAAGSALTFSSIGLFGGGLIAAGAALMLAFGLLAEDGLAIALGLAATAATLALYAAAIWLALAAVMAL